MLTPGPQILRSKADCLPGQGEFPSACPKGQYRFMWRRSSVPLTNPGSALSFVIEAIMRKKRLGEILKAKGRITESDLQAAIAQRRGKALLLGELLLSRGLVSR